MTAFNAVRFRVKPGREQEFLDAHENAEADWPRPQSTPTWSRRGSAPTASSPNGPTRTRSQRRGQAMIATLDSFRDTLEDLGGGLGVTDPVSGPVVLALK